MVSSEIIVCYMLLVCSIHLILSYINASYTYEVISTIDYTDISMVSY